MADHHPLRQSARPARIEQGRPGRVGDRSLAQGAGGPVSVKQGGKRRGSRGLAKDDHLAAQWTSAMPPAPVSRVSGVVSRIRRAGIAQPVRQLARRRERIDRHDHAAESRRGVKSDDVLEAVWREDGERRRPCGSPRRASPAAARRTRSANCPYVSIWPLAPSISAGLWRAIGACAGRRGERNHPGSQRRGKDCGRSWCASVSRGRSEPIGSASAAAEPRTPWCAAAGIAHRLIGRFPSPRIRQAYVSATSSPT